MNLGGVMDDLGKALKPIKGLRVNPYYSTVIVPPMAVVAFPDPIMFDLTAGRGVDRQTFPLYVMVGRVDARVSRDNLSKYLDGAGKDSIKQAIESYEVEGMAYDSARVDRVQVGTVTASGIDYLTATFYIDILGRGA